MKDVVMSFSLKIPDSRTYILVLVPGTHASAGIRRRLMLRFFRNIGIASYEHRLDYTSGVGRYE